MGQLGNLVTMFTTFIRNLAHLSLRNHERELIADY